MQKGLSAILALILLLLVWTACLGQRGTWKLLGGPPGGSITCLALDNSGSVLVGTVSGQVVRSSDFGNSCRLIFSTPGQQALSSLAVTPAGRILAGSWDLYISNPTGTNWSKAEFINLETSPYVEVICPAPGGKVFCATYLSRIWKSQDEGVHFVSSSGGLPPFGSVWSILPLNSSELVSSVDISTYLSTNAGDQWIKTSLDNVYVTGGFAVDSRARIYAGAASYVGTPVGGVFSTSDKGNHWTNLGLTNQYVTALMIDRDDNIFAATLTGLYRSSDYGSSWTQPSGSIAGMWVTSLIQLSDGSLLAGTRFYGAQRSTDGGNHWQQTQLPASRVQAMCWSGTGDLFAAASDGPEQLHGLSGSKLYRSADSARSWTVVPLSASPIYSVIATHDGKLFATTASGIYVSSDNGSSWRLSSTAFAQGASSLTVDQRGYVYAGSNRSTDGGSTWTSFQISLESAAATALTIPQNGTVLLGTSGKYGGSIFRSTDDGASWNLTHNGVNMGEQINALTVSHSGAILAASSVEGILRSQDGGITWINSTLSASSVQSVFVAADGTIYAGTTGGSFFSSDDGLHWTAFDSTELGTTIINFMIDASDGKVFAATDGLGIARSELSGGIIDTTSPIPGLLSQNYPNPFSLKTSFSITVPQPNQITIQIYNVLGQRVNTVIDNYLPSGTYSFDFHSDKLASGLYFCRLQIGGQSILRKMLLMR
jgi:hypothetical protein